MRRYHRSQPGVGVADYLIAATAQVRDYKLATLNIRHFPMFNNLKRPFELS